MKKFMLFFYALCCAAFLIPTNMAFSQQYAEVANEFPNMFHRIEGVELSNFQAEKAQKAYSLLRHRSNLTRDAFLFPDDEIEEIRTHQKRYYEDLSKILRPEQMVALDAHFNTELTKRVEDQAFLLLENYDHLDLSLEQANAIAIDLDSLMTDHVYGRTAKEKVIKKHLTEEQANQFENPEKKEREKNEMAEERVVELSDYERNEIEELKQAKPFLSILLNSIEEFYMPERALIRGKLERDIFANEKIAIDDLRALYADYLEEQLDKSKHLRYLPYYEDEEYNQAVELVKEISAVMEKELFEGAGSSTLYRVLCTDRDAFYLARELAEKFDKQIDLLQKDIDLLEAGVMERMIVGMSEKYRHKSKIEDDLKSKKRSIGSKKYSTSKIEYRRNIAFLLVKGIEGLDDEINSDRGLHNLFVYPVPALDRQTVSFAIKTSGHTTVEIISQDGKVLKNIFSGKLEAGEYNMEAVINNIQTDMFFYRVSGKDGVSIAKSMRG